MRTFINLKNTHDYDLSEHFKKDDVRFAGVLVRHFLSEFTNEGDTVFDPFSGFGTSLFVAREMNRIPYGLEYDAERHAFIRQNLGSENIIHGDVRRLADYDLPAIDFAITSPPYMRPQDKENPLAAYTTNDGNYENYLQGLQDILSTRF